jgi:signal transduction histidine kinase
MNPQLALIAAAALANIGLGVVVLARQRHSKINQYFALFSFSVAMWTVSNALALAQLRAFSADFFPRLAFASASIIPIGFLLFSTVFPTTHPLAPKRAVLGFVGVGLIFALASFSHLIVRDVISSDGAFRILYGPLHLPFAIYFMSGLGFSLFVLVKKRRALSGFERLQVQYLFLGVLLAAIGATATNLIVPLVLRSSSLSRFGPLFGLVMIAMIAHSIVRYRLMNLRLVLRQGSVYLIAATIAGAVFSVVIVVGSNLVGGRPQDVPVPFLVAIAMAIALAFQPLKTWIQATLDRYLYRESYDYQRTLREASRTISGTLDLKSLLEYLCDTANRILRPDIVSAFARDSRDGAFWRAAHVTIAELHPEQDISRVSAAAPLPSFLMSHRGPLVRDEVGRTLRGHAAEAASADLRALGGEVAIPMMSESQLIGFVVVGTKLSGDAYFTDDIELLSTLSNQAAIAVNNAQLYGRVVLVNEYIENILRTMDSGVITVDATGQVEVVNTTAEKLTRLSEPTLKAMTVESLPKPLGSQLQDTLSDGEPRLQLEASLPLDSEESSQLLPVACSTAALRDEKGSIRGALIVFSDLSKLKALESDKRRAERLAAFGTLVSGIAHEIKNPLVAIKTFAELLPERFLDTDFREDFAKVVITEIDRIDDLVARLRGLAIPTLRVGGAIDLRDPIVETLALLRAQLEQSRVTVIREFQDDEPYVVADTAQLKQLFLNLFLNALEAMGRDGELIVRITRKRIQSDTWLIAEVTDTGPGIPEGIRASIFNPFFTTKSRGSGLGLAICRGIVDAHRGTIRAEPRHDRPGTTMIVEFPAGVQTPAFAETNALLQ